MEVLGLSRSTPAQNAIDCKSRRGISISWREREPGFVPRRTSPAREQAVREIVIQTQSEVSCGTNPNPGVQRRPPVGSIRQGTAATPE